MTLGYNVDRHNSARIARLHKRCKSVKPSSALLNTDRELDRRLASYLHDVDVSRPTVGRRQKQTFLGFSRTIPDVLKFTTWSNPVRPVVSSGWIALILNVSLIGGRRIVIVRHLLIECESVVAVVDDLYWSPSAFQ